MRRRIIIFDTAALFREGLGAMLRDQPQLKVVATAGELPALLQRLKVLKPDLLICDIFQAGEDPAHFIAAAKRSSARTRILALTFERDEEHVERALRAGVDGYVLKDDDQHALILAVQNVASGHKYLSAAITHYVIHGYLGARPLRRSAPSRDSLTRREQQIIRLVAEGYRTREIARFLTLSHKTVEKHRASMMRKLALRSVAAVVAYAIAHGYKAP